MKFKFINLYFLFHDIFKFDLIFFWICIWFDFVYIFIWIFVWKEWWLWRYDWLLCGLIVFENCQFSHVATKLLKWMSLVRSDKLAHFLKKWSICDIFSTNPYDLLHNNLLLHWFSGSIWSKICGSRRSYF